MESARQTGKLASVVKEYGSQFDEVLEYSDEQLKTDLIPLYEKMLELFTRNLWLAEKSTLQYHGALAEFVEIWKRYLSDALPKAVIQSVGHSEERLQAFYNDFRTILNGSVMSLNSNEPLGVSQPGDFGLQLRYRTLIESDGVSVRVVLAAKGGKIPLLKFEKESEFLKFGYRHISALLFWGMTLTA